VLDIPPACCPGCDCCSFEGTPFAAELPATFPAEFPAFTLAVTTAAPLTEATPTLEPTESTGAVPAGDIDAVLMVSTGAATAEP